MIRETSTKAEQALAPDGLTLTFQAAGEEQRWAARKACSRAVIKTDLTVRSWVGDSEVFTLIRNRIRFTQLEVQESLGGVAATSVSS